MPSPFFCSDTPCNTRKLPYLPLHNGYCRCSPPLPPAAVYLQTDETPSQSSTSVQLPSPLYTQNSTEYSQPDTPRTMRLCTQCIPCSYVQGWQSRVKTSTLFLVLRLQREQNSIILISVPIILRVHILHQLSPRFSLCWGSCVSHEHWEPLR